MPRIPRKNIKTSICHLIVQGLNKEYIFRQNKYKNIYRNLIRKKLEGTNITILAYCIMDNHAHILVYSDKINEISKLMQRVNCSFAKFYNNSKKRVGYVFKDRYHLQIILNKRHLYNCISYIHRNPLNANMVRKLDDYLYSSYREYIQNKKILISNDSIELLFGQKNNYMKEFDILHAPREIEDIKEVIEKTKDYKIIICEYSEYIQKTIEEITKDEKDFSELLMILRHECDLSLREMEKIFGISRNKLNRMINKGL